MSGMSLSPSSERWCSLRVQVTQGWGCKLAPMGTGDGPPGTQALGGEMILHSGQVGSEHFPPPAALRSQTQWAGH